jgi:SAM-dependent methyltransferase
MKKSVSWKETAGREYNSESKKVFLNWVNDFLLQREERKDKARQVLIDVGSGSKPIYKNLNKKDVKSISIDIVKGVANLKRHIIYNLNSKNNSKDEIVFLKKLRKLANVSKKLKNFADVIIFSEILNYVDYKKVLVKFIKFLKKDGVAIILNQPGRGLEQLFHTKGVKKNIKLINFLKKELMMDAKYYYLKVKNPRTKEKYLIVFLTKHEK